MNIQEHLAVFDSWLTCRIGEANASGKDLAFRDLAAEIRLGENAWEYSLLAPGQLAPQGEGWSVYRLQGIWPGFAKVEAGAATTDNGPKRGLLAKLSGALFGQDKAR